MGSDNKIKELKAPVVVFKETIMKVGESTIPAPIGVKIDYKTGEIMVPVKIAPAGDVVLIPKIEKKLLINEGFVRLKMLFKDPDPEPCPDVRKDIRIEIIVPIQSVHHIDYIRPHDQVQESAKIEAITIRGIPDNSLPRAAGQKANLLIKVVLKVQVTVMREEIVPVKPAKRSD